MTDNKMTYRGGFPILFFNLLFSLGLMGLFIFAVAKEIPPLLLIIIFLLGPTNLILYFGFFAQEPNEAHVMTLFGEYTGTAVGSGFFWTNPFNRKTSISFRTRNFDGPRLKVNDKMGNPIEISAVIVWRVEDAARALFDVNDYASYVTIQSDSAVRHLGTLYAYDNDPESKITLLSGGETLMESLKRELQERLGKAGVVVEEARINHLAYTPEIAGAMLKRQQAEAIIAARQKIVEGAVSMVDMALKHLADRKVVNLDEERKAAMVSNLLVILCGDHEATPVVNTGSLY